MADKKPVSPMALSVLKQLIYAKGTDAAMAFAEQHEHFTTNELVRAIIDATWDDIRKAG